jgi:hypothetical protein
MFRYHQVSLDWRILKHPEDHSELISPLLFKLTLKCCFDALYPCNIERTGRMLPFHNLVTEFSPRKDCQRPDLETMFSSLPLFPTSSDHASKITEQCIQVQSDSEWRTGLALSRFETFQLEAVSRVDRSNKGMFEDPFRFVSHNIQEFHRPHQNLRTEVN